MAGGGIAGFRPQMLIGLVDRLELEADLPGAFTVGDPVAA
jgi:hypothetical protein